MRPLSARMFPDTVIFMPAAYVAALPPDYTGRAAILAGYVETTTGMITRDESDSRAESRTHYRIFTGSDPAALLDREVTADDVVLWVKSVVASPGVLASGSAYSGGVDGAPLDALALDASPPPMAPTGTEIQLAGPPARQGPVYLTEGNSVA